MRGTGFLRKCAAKKLVIFDLDGTLVDAYQAVEDSVNFTLGKLGYKPVSAWKIKRSVGWGEVHLISRFLEEEDLPAAIKIYRAHHPQALRRGTKLLPGALAILKQLKSQGYLLAVASNRATRFTRLILRHLRITKYFDCVLCRDRVARPKPYPDILRGILEKLALPPREALFVGDMVVDIQAGKRARIDTVGVVTGSSTGKEIRAFNPKAVIRNIHGLRRILIEIDRR